MEEMRIALRDKMGTAAQGRMSTGTSRSSTLGLLVVLLAFGASGCTDSSCGPTSPSSSDSFCSSHRPMQPTYFPAIAG
jgi:hypothetical protein